MSSNVVLFAAIMKPVKHCSCFFSICAGNEKRIVCYFTHYSVLPQYDFRASKTDPSLCTHIMFVYNVLNEETLLHQKADGDQDVDGKTLIETT
jgi:hypothetical protein